MHEYAAVVLAGGAGRRLAGPGKARLAVGGRAMLARVLDAVADAHPRVVVEPPAGDLPRGVWRTCEEPPGGGPVAGIAAGLAALRPHAGLSSPAGAGAAAPGESAGSVRQRRMACGVVAVLAADQPFLTAQAVAELRGALTAAVDGVLFVDAAGRRQLLCGVWWAAALLDRLVEFGDPRDRALRNLIAPLRVAELTWVGAGPPPWYDCDTEADLHYAREWAGT